MDIEIDLIRHVKVVGKPALYGGTDVAPIAVENARLLQGLLAQQQSSKAYHAIVCSPLVRCYSVAKEFANLCQLPLTLSADLQEMNFGCFDGVPFDDLIFDQADEKNRLDSKKSFDNSCVTNKLYWSALEAFFNAPADIVLPGAETLADFNQRVIAAWQKLITEQVKLTAQQIQHKTLKPKRILLIAHGGVIRMILAHVLQLNWQQASWHQNLQVSYGSLSRVGISAAEQANAASKLNSPCNSHQQFYQQVTSIAMPFLEEIS